MNKNPLRLKLAEILRYELVRNRVKQNSIADQLGVTPSAISQLLQGKITPSMVQLNSICEMLGLSRHRVFELRCLLSKIRCGDESVQSPLGELLAKYRRENGFSLTDVARACQLPENLLELMENTPDVVPDMGDLQRLAIVLRCPKEELFTAAGLDWRVFETGEPIRELGGLSLRENTSNYQPNNPVQSMMNQNQGYAQVPGMMQGMMTGMVPNNMMPNMMPNMTAVLPTTMRFRDFWRRITSAGRDIYGNTAAEVASFPIDRPLELILRGSDLDLAGCSAWKLTVKNLSSLCAGELALVRERASKKMALLMLDSSRSALVGRKLFRKSNKALPLNERDFDIIIPVSSIEFIPHGRV